MSAAVQLDGGSGVRARRCTVAKGCMSLVMRRRVGDSEECGFGNRERASGPKTHPLCYCRICVVESVGSMVDEA